MTGFTSNGYFDLSNDADSYDILDSILVVAPRGVRGLLGNDSLKGSFTDDLINGNEGSDSILGGASNDTLYGGKGNDVLLGGEGDDVLFGNKGDDWLKAEGGGDRLYGGQGNDVIVGAVGDDYLAGELGYDVLTGNTGVNSFAINPLAFGAQNLDVILDFQRSIDRIVLTRGLRASTLVFEQTTLTNQALAQGISSNTAVPLPTGFSLANVGSVRSYIKSATGVEPDPNGDGLIPGVLVRNASREPLFFVAGETQATLGGRFVEVASF